MLLDRGANVNGADHATRRYRRPLQTACEGGHTQIVSMLLEKGANANRFGGYYDYALHTACIRGHGSVVGMLLDHGADVNASSIRLQDGNTRCLVHSLTIA